MLFGSYWLPEPDAERAFFGNKNFPFEVHRQVQRNFL
jgi:hypothetical protein